MTPATPTDRLEPLIWLPPSIATGATAAPVQTGATTLARTDGTKITLDIPLFWYDPPWHHAEPKLADVVAKTVAQLGVVVTALGRDLAAIGDKSTFHQTNYAGGSNSDSATACVLRRLPRTVPYRPERYGLYDSDFDDAMIIDVRLVVNRDDDGRFAFAPEQIARWEATPDGSPIAEGARIPSSNFPPDVPAIEKLTSKLQQLRILSPTAAVFVSMSPYRLDQELPTVLKQNPDGVILRADDNRISGLMLAAMTRRARQWMKHERVADMPLWIVPGEISADDAAKLVALGASGVAIDHWCDPIINQATDATDHSSAARLGYKSIRSSQEAVLVDLVHYHLDDAMVRFKGLSDAMSSLPSEERIGTFDAAWSKALGVRQVSFGVQP